MRRVYVWAVLACSVSPLAATARGQAAAFTIAARDSSAIMRRVADGVYAITHDNATEEWPHGNTGVVVGTRDVLVIDTDYFPSRAAADIALIRQVTKLPVRYLVNTHWHGDHTHGNGVYRDSFPGLAILGPRAAATFIELNQTKLPRGAQFPDSYQHQQIARLEGELRKGSDSSGHAFTADERKDIATNISQRRIELSELAKVAVAPPNQIFENAFDFDLGERRVEIRNMGPANSAADVVVYLPAERVLFTGDILVYPTPYTAGSFFMPWISVLREVVKYPVGAMVLGHGPVMSNNEFARNVLELFDTIRLQLDSLYREGYVPPEAVKRVNVKHLREKFRVPEGRAVREAYWEEYTRMLADKMSLCVMGYSC